MVTFHAMKFSINGVHAENRAISADVVTFLLEKAHNKLFLEYRCMECIGWRWPRIHGSKSSERQKEEKRKRISAGDEKNIAKITKQQKG